MGLQTPERNILIYGGGGIGKTTRLAEIAAYVYLTFGLKTRVVGADGGGTTSAFGPLIEEGIAEYWPIDQWEEYGIFNIMDLATKGWWPEDPSEPGSILLPPAIRFKPCSSCGKDSGAKGLGMVPKCSSCGKQFAAGTTLRTVSQPINGMEKVGFVAFEGLTAFGDLLLRRLKKVNSDGGRRIEDKLPDGSSFTISAPGQQHYGDAQSYLAQFVTNCRQIPTKIIAWTALELRGEEDGKPLYGPKGPGKALTSTCIPWFTDVLHLDAVAKRGKMGVVEKDENGQEILDRKLYLAPHFPADAPQFRFAAKTSIPNGGDMPTVIEPDMKVFFVELEKANQKAKARLLEGKSNNNQTKENK